MQKKKILYVITKSNWGGAQKYVYELATALPRDEYEVAVALGGTGGQKAVPGILVKKLETKNIRTAMVPHFMRDMSLVDDVRAFFELWHIVRTERPHILHTTSSKAGGMGVVIGRLCGVSNIVFTSHGLAFDESWRTWWQRALMTFFTWLTVLLSTRTIMISTETYERASSMPFCKKRVALVHNGIHTPALLPKQEARSALFPNATDETLIAPWIGSIAEYHPNKKLGVLIDATALFVENNIPIHTFLIGDGEQRGELIIQAQKQHVEEHVHFVKCPENASRYLQAFNVFALPSKKEGLPYVLLEAGAAALPVVASNITGNRDIIEHERSGLVVDATAQHFYDACLSLIENEAKARMFAQTLHSRVTTQFSIEHMVNETAKLYVANPSISLSASSRRTERA